MIVLTRRIATDMAAAVIARLVLYPTGSLAAVPTAALAAGFLAYLGAGRRIFAAILVAQSVLVALTLVAAMP